MNLPLQNRDCLNKNDLALTRKWWSNGRPVVFCSILERSKGKHIYNDSCRQLHTLSKEKCHRGSSLRRVRSDSRFRYIENLLTEGREE